jgi:hypothetical protein
MWATGNALTIASAVAGCWILMLAGMHSDPLESWTSIGVGLLLLHAAGLEKREIPRT